MRLWPHPVVLLFAGVAAAQTPPASAGPTATVSGVVHDSIARAPLPGALVQLVASDSIGRWARTVVSDSLGQYTHADVPQGRYTIGFFHPMLDSLGLEPTLREVVVEGRRAVRADLAIPSPARVRSAICGAGPGLDVGGVVVGVVRSADDRGPLSDASVAGEWLELSLRPDGIMRRMPRLVATTGPSGWFALCNVPAGGAMTLLAARGADSTDRIELLVPASGFLRRELFLGRARAVGTNTTRHVDSLAMLSRVFHTGDGRLSGTVVTATGGQPLSGAQVAISGGPRTRANDRGEWTLTDAPAGTRLLEVRAVGYYPETRAVDVIADAPAVRVALATLKSVLDTVNVRAPRLTGMDRNAIEARRRSGVGRHITPDEIARRGPIFISDIFRQMSGIRVEYDTSGAEQRIQLHGSFAGDSSVDRDPTSRWCSPAIYFNGHHMGILGTDDIDALAQPKDVAAIEIYSETTVPPQFNRAQVGCGSILIWTK